MVEHRDDLEWTFPRRWDLLENFQRRFGVYSLEMRATEEYKNWCREMNLRFGKPAESRAVDQQIYSMVIRSFLGIRNNDSSIRHAMCYRVLAVHLGILRREAAFRGDIGGISEEQKESFVSQLCEKLAPYIAPLHRSEVKTIITEATETLLDIGEEHEIDGTVAMPPTGMYVHTVTRAAGSEAEND